MKEIMEKTEAVISKYNEQLTANSIKIAASKRYFEMQVGERVRNTGSSAIFNGIARARDRKKEKNRGYNHERNRYHCIVLTVSPIEKDIVRREYCREYAFVLKKVERAHIGMEPKKVTYEKEKLFSKIEKRLLKILSKAQKTNARKVCKDTLYDALRYVSPKYRYKRRFLNRRREEWELILLMLTGIFALAVVFMKWLIDKLI